MIRKPSSIVLFLVILLTVLQIITTTSNTKLSSYIFVEAFGNGTETETYSETQKITESHSPSPDVSASYSVSGETVSMSYSDSYSHDPGECSTEYSVFPISVNTMPYSDILGAPDNLIGGVFHYNQIKATELARDGFSVAVRMQNGVFYPQVDSLPIAMKIYTKTTLIQGVLSNAEQVIASNVEDDYTSHESHGFNDYFPQLFDRGLFVFRRSNSQISLQVKPLPGYRLAADEWISFSFFYNATAPLGCAIKPAVIRVTAYEYSFYVPVIGALALFVMVCGVVAAASQHTIPTAHHAPSIAIMAAQHFANEDGQPLPLALSPFQLSFGTSKYRYIYGAMYGNAAIILLSFFGQQAAMKYVAMKKNYESRTEAARAVAYPRLTSALVMCFLGSILYSIGRSYGNQTVSSFFVTSLVLVFTAWVIQKTHRVNISASMAFQAEFVKNEVPNLHPLLPPTQVTPKLQNTFLSSLRSRFTLQKKGYWKSTDTSGAFVPCYGFVFESYKPSSRSWLLIEVIDISLMALLSVLDNYSVATAFIQFFMTLVLKFILLLLLIRRKPLLASQSATALLANYSGQVLGYLALLIGSLRLELLRAADMVQGVGCAISMIGLLYDVLVHITTGVFNFYDLYHREKIYEEDDETTKHGLLELSETFKRGKTGEELEKKERETKLKWWWENVGKIQRKDAEDLLGTQAARDRERESIRGESNNTQQQQQQKQQQSSSSLNEHHHASSSSSVTTSGAFAPAATTANLSEEFKKELESDRDWIYGKATERQTELPHYQDMPLWNDLTFEEQTTFFRMLFRGELEPESRKQVDVKKAEERKLMEMVESDSDDEQNALEAASLGVKKEQQQQSASSAARPRSLSPTSSNTNINVASSNSASPSSAPTTTSIHVNFAHHYDDDGLFIDRYHPLYKAKKEAKREKKRAANAAAASAAASASSYDQQQKRSAASTLTENEESKLKEASSISVPSSATAASATRSSGGGYIGVGGSNKPVYVSTSETALARDWNRISDNTYSPPIMSYLTEDDFTSL